MLDVLLTLAVTAPGEEPTSKTFFYVAGAILACWAVVLGAVGMGKEDWPTATGARGIIGVTAALMAVTMVAAVVTA